METDYKINTRLEKLREFVSILESLKGIAGQDLKSDVDKKAKAERFLQLAIEACIDIAELVIVKERLETPQTAGEAITILGKNGILELGFAEEFSKIAGFRNILIHDYVDIDYEQVADKINNRLGDFDIFAKSVAKHLTS